jgi:hypothetical protein
MSNENETKIRDLAGQSGTESPVKSPAGVLDLSRRLAEAESRLAMATEFSVGNDLVIVQRGHGKWAISDRFQNVMTVDGEWEYEPMPSSRTDDFIARTRFTLDEAFARLGPSFEAA